MGVCFPAMFAGQDLGLDMYGCLALHSGDGFLLLNTHPYHVPCRSQAFFAGDTNPNVTKLRNILLSYGMWNFNLGYCQVRMVRMAHAAACGYMHAFERACTL